MFRQFFHVGLSLDVRAVLWGLDRISRRWKSRTARLRQCFDENWYDTQYRLPKNGLHGFAHYLKIGARAGYSPNAVFNEQAYLAAYSDVAAVVAGGALRSGFEHYVLNGSSEQRAPAPKEYLSANRDWSRAVGAIANQAGVSSASIGKVDVRESHS